VTIGKAGTLERRENPVGPVIYLLMEVIHSKTSKFRTPSGNRHAGRMDGNGEKPGCFILINKVADPEVLEIFPARASGPCRGIPPAPMSEV